MRIIANKDVQNSVLLDSERSVKCIFFYIYHRKRIVINVKSNLNF